MPPERQQDGRLEAEGVLVRAIDGQVYLIEEGTEDATLNEEEQGLDRSPLSGLISRQ